MQSRAIVRLARSSVIAACVALHPTVTHGEAQPPPPAAVTTNALPAPAIRFPLELQPLKAEYDKEKAVLAASRAMKMRAVIEDQLKSSREAAKDKERTGNVRGMAVARQAQNILNNALTELEQNGSCTLPDSVRSELVELRSTLLSALTEASAQYSNGLQRLDLKYTPDFIAIAKRQNLLAADDSIAAQSALFERWTQWDAATNAAPRPAEAASATAPGATNDAPSSEWSKIASASATAAGATAAAEAFTQSSASAAWKPVGRWTGRMSNIEVLDLPVVGVTANSKDSIANPISSDSSTWTYEVVEPIPAGSRGPFRLVSIPGQHRVHVEEWPTRANQGHLVFRTPSVLFPASVGFELQIGPRATVPEGAAVGNTESARTSKIPLVQVRVLSKPAGASVARDGLAVNTAAGTPAHTPCILKMEPGPHAVKLTMDGYIGQVIGDFRAFEGATIDITLAPVASVPGRVVTVNAQSSGWQGTDITLKPGDELWLFPSGTWNIGAGNEPCGPEGYPQSGKTAAYYKAATDPRQQESEPYGALLMQIGPIASAVAVTNTMKYSVAFDGLLFFDVNEQVTPALRANNKGSIKIKTVLLREGTPVNLGNAARANAPRGNRRP